VAIKIRHSKLITLSPSRVKTWVRCKKSYYWKYVEGLERILKAPRLSLGSIASEVFAGYYNQLPQDRNQAMLDSIVFNTLSSNKNTFLGNNPNEERKEEWGKICRILPKVFANYHLWALGKDKDLSSPCQQGYYWRSQDDLRAQA